MKSLVELSLFVPWDGCRTYAIPRVVSCTGEVFILAALIRLVGLSELLQAYRYRLHDNAFIR